MSSSERSTVAVAVLARLAWGLAGLAALASTSCKSTNCGTGTVDDNGTCKPADETVGTAACGPFTMFEGDQCVPQFPPTVCDPATTTPSTNPTTGVTTCIGNGGGGGCSAPFACPTPTDSSKQTICGQLYDFENNSLFQGPNPAGVECSAATSSGPCALQIQAFDAVQYGNDPTGTPPLATDPVYIDDCGRYRVPNITLTGGPFVALGIDDAGQPLGPAGVTNTTGVALPQQPGVASPNFEAFIVTQATTDGWTSSGGPPVSAGIYVGVFRTHVCAAADAMCTGDAFATQGGVTFTKSGVTEPTDDYYFTAAATHDDVDPVATATSLNGTGLLTNASVNDSLVYSGTGGITDTVNCKWETHAAASLANIVFFQIYRPVNSAFNTTCTQ